VAPASRARCRRRLAAVPRPQRAAMTSTDRSVASSSRLASRIRAAAPCRSARRSTGPACAAPSPHAGPGRRRSAGPPGAPAPTGRCSPGPHPARAADARATGPARRRGAAPRPSAGPRRPRPRCRDQRAPAARTSRSRRPARRWSAPLPRPPKARPGRLSPPGTGRRAGRRTASAWWPGGHQVGPPRPGRTRRCTPRPSGLRGQRPGATPSTPAHPDHPAAGNPAPPRCPHRPAPPGHAQPARKTLRWTASVRPQAHRQ